MRKLILSSGLLFMFCISCVYNHTSNTENLGNGYFFLGDGNESQILVGNEKKNYGSTVVPQEVIKYNFDEKYIIAKSLNVLDNKTIESYWIIDKQNKKDSIYGLDSLSFVKKIKKLSINLILKSRK
ncbi:DUF3997 domain-containing protein [Flavobacterium sp. 3HN19-14]|uniref:DUF3997 domain-containing protein n=1 Tax=Flavobacterium sp. 3HN19-14 TaxID=3448133 RepID=UPI003EDF1F5B